jgi:putative transposase
MAARRIERRLASRPNEIWAMDFVSDAPFNEKRLRALTVVDAFTREGLAIHADQGIKGDAVATVMEHLMIQRGTAPTKIRVDNGPEFISRALDQWAYMNKVTLDFSRPGKPTGNAFVESFIGRG